VFRAALAVTTRSQRQSRFAGYTWPRRYP